MGLIPHTCIIYALYDNILTILSYCGAALGRHNRQTDRKRFFFFVFVSVVALPHAEPRPESGHFRGVPPERRQVLQLPEKTHVQPVVPEPRQPVAVQQHGQRRRVRLHDFRPGEAVRRRGHRRPAQHDQFRVTSGVHVAGVHAGLQQQRRRRRRQAARSHAVDVGHAREKQEQILPNSVINVPCFVVVLTFQSFSFDFTSPVL